MTTAAETCPDALPMRVSVNFDHPHTPDRVAFGERRDGTVVTLDTNTGHVVKIVGVAGAGKTATAQTLVTAALLAGCEVFVTDTVRMAADYSYAKPWLRGVATSRADALEMLEELHADMTRRTAAIVDHGVGHIRDLPANIRPKPQWLVMDDFMALVSSQGPVAARYADPELEKARIEREDDHRTARRIVDVVQQLAADGGSVGVNLVVVSQRLTSAMLEDYCAGSGKLSELAKTSHTVLLGKSPIGAVVTHLRDYNTDLTFGQVPAGRGIFEPVRGDAEVVQVWRTHPFEHFEQLSLRLPRLNGTQPWG